jgi:hypothetical protein
MKDILATAALHAQDIVLANARRSNYEQSTFYYHTDRGYVELRIDSRLRTSLRTKDGITSWCSPSRYIFDNLGITVIEHAQNGLNPTQKVDLVITADLE